MRINFDDLIANHEKVISYACKQSDSFSVISNRTQPCASKPFRFEHEQVMKGLDPFLERSAEGIREWPGTITRDHRKVMLVYRSCKQSRKILQEMPNLFLPDENGLPEDLCFYRNGRHWFATVSHEQMAFLTDATREDLAFFKTNGIRIYG